MKKRSIIIFIFILFFFLIFYFLGTSYKPLCMEGLTTGTFTGSDNVSTHNNSYDNYNHYDGTSLQTIYYGENGSTAKLTKQNDIYVIVVTDKSGSTTVFTVNKQNKTTNSYTSDSSPTASNDFSMNTYISENGATARIVKTLYGNEIVITDKDGNVSVYITKKTHTYNPSHAQNDAGTSAGTSAGTNGSSAGYASGPNGSSAGYVSGPNGNSAGYASGPNGNTVAAAASSSSSSSSAYDSVFPKGIPASQIPPGQQDLYILKSEVVPPVCPACPAQPCTGSGSGSGSGSLSKEKCPPCPACARCPEPSFECKKVPNYNAISNDYLPVPVVNSFSTFGM